MTYSRKRWLTAWLTCLGLSSAVCAMADSRFMQEENITCRNGNVMISRQGRLLLDDDFMKDSGKWEPFTNFEDILLGVYGGEHQGTKGFLITHGPKAGTDTAYEVTSRPLPVSAGNEYVLTVSGRSSLNLQVASTNGEQYRTEIKWLDKNQKPLEPTPFRTNFRNRAVSDNRFIGIVPKDAAFAVIRMGGDHPNVAEGEYIIYTKAVFESENPGKDFCQEGSFVSRPLKLSRVGQGELAWIAQTPAGTSVGLQLATAPDVNGVPGKWTPFAGPNGKADAFYSVNGTALPVFPDGHAWIRYRAVLKGTTKVTPELKSVSLGAVTDRGWEGLDREAPEILRVGASVNPDPMAPIQFCIKDATAVDWNTVRITMDDEDISASVTCDGDILTFSPKAPGLAVSPDVFEKPSCWTVTSNLKNYLSFGPVKGEEGVLRVTREESEVDTFFELVSPEYGVVPGAEITVSMDIRHTLALGNSGRNIPFRLHWLNAARKKLGNPVSIPVKNIKDWQTCRVTVTVPAGAAFVYAACGFDAPNIHSDLYFDIRKPVISGKELVMVPVKKPNLHTFTVSAADSLGHKTEQTFFALVDTPVEKNIVTIRKDGAVLIDGKPFFPIGLYAVWKRDFNNNDFNEAFDGLRKGGFNLAHTYNSTRTEDFRDFMNAAQRHDVKLYIASGQGANHISAKDYLKDVINERKHPAMLSWYLADDTASHVTAEQVRLLHNAIHDIDNAHITCQADPVGNPGSSRYRAYVHSTDCFMPEIYPVRKGVTDDKMVPKVIQDMKVIQADLAAHGNPPKTIWPIIQYFQGWSSWTRFPTYDELRAMSFLSIIHGGNGITWYTYGGSGENHGCCATPENWTIMCKVATQLRDLQDVFLTECYEKAEAPVIVSGPAKDALGFDSISVLFKRVGDRQFLICANSAAKEVWVKLKAKGVSKGKVWFEGRNITLSGGAFTDKFKPNDVHVYELVK